MNEEPIEIFIDKKCIVFKLRGGFEYDPDLSLTKNPLWIQHMREKDWFTSNVEKQTKEILKAHCDIVNFGD